MGEPQISQNFLHSDEVLTPEPSLTVKVLLVQGHTSNPCVISQFSSYEGMFSVIQGKELPFGLKQVSWTSLGFHEDVCPLNPEASSSLN